MSGMADLDDYVEHFRWRILQDAMQEATSDYWHRRAAQFAAVGTPECDQVAELCRHRADLSLGGDDSDDGLIAAVLAEVA